MGARSRAVSLGIRRTKNLLPNCKQYSVKASDDNASGSSGLKVALLQTSRAGGVVSLGGAGARACRISKVVTSRVRSSYGRSVDIAATA